MKVVLDANVIVSAALLKRSAAFQVFKAVIEAHYLLISESTLDELRDVLYRPHLEKYFHPEDTRPSIIAAVLNNAKVVTPDVVIRACRDIRDDAYLELAVSGGADCIISGDKDLLVLNPFRGIQIIEPREFLNKYKL